MATSIRLYCGDEKGIGTFGRCEDAFGRIGINKGRPCDSHLVQLVMGEHRTEWGMLIQVKLGLDKCYTATGWPPCKELHSTQSPQNFRILSKDKLLLMQAYRELGGSLG
ncbi:hypothetical protein Tco_0780945 [Tanacetum coccineum]